MKILLLISLSLLPIGLHGTELSPATFLKKISMHLRGTTPTLAEYEALKRAQARGTDQAFIQKKISEYLATQAHADKMEFRLHELFQTRTPPAPRDLKRPIGSARRELPYVYNSTLSALFRKIAEDDLSWDTLLTGRTYSIFNYDPKSVTASGDLEFYSAIESFRAAFPLKEFTTIEDLERGHDSFIGQDTPHFAKPRSFTFTADDPRVAGAITTLRFFDRYTNSALNKNRRRAAAIFKIFLCDEMNAAVVSDRNNLQRYLELAFPGAHFTPEEIRAADAPTHPVDLHGSRKDCMACHYKLDPVGEVFQTSGQLLSPYAAQGRLTYQNLKGPNKGQITDIPVNGFAELGEAITKQPEYAQCQVRHFWEWFIGKDRDLPQERLEELTRDFDRLGRKTNAFIRHLILQPEFRTPERDTPEKKIARQARAVLQNCTTCHAAYDLPRFTEWPIGGTLESHRGWLSKINDRLDLPHDGAQRDMPPEDSPWQPTPDDIHALKAWIDGKKDGEKK